MAVGRGTWPDVDDHIEDDATGTADQLGFPTGVALVVHAPEGSFSGRKRQAVLRIINFQPVSPKLLNAESACEEAALVARRFKLDEVCVAKLGRLKFHDKPACVTRYDRNRPGFRSKYWQVREQIASSLIPT